MNDLENELFSLMAKHYRPFSLSDIIVLLSRNGHLNVSKSTVQQSLEKLVQQNKLFEKSYNKQTLYCYLHSNQLSSDTDVDSILTQTKQSRQHVADLDQQCNQLKNEIHRLSLLDTTEVIAIKKQRMLEEIEDLKNNQRNTTDAIDYQEYQQIVDEYQKILKIWKNRKRIALDMIERMCEGANVSEDQLLSAVNLNWNEINTASKNCQRLI